MSSKKQHQKIVESIFAIVPEGTSVDNFQIAEDGRVSFFASCLSFKILENFLKELQADDKGTHLKIKEARIENLSYGFEKEYHYNVSIAFYLGED